MSAHLQASAQTVPGASDQGQQILVSTWSETATAVTAQSESESNGEASEAVLWDLATRLLHESGENRRAVDSLRSSLRSVSEGAAARLDEQKTLLDQTFEKAEQLEAIVVRISRLLERQRARSRQQSKDIAALTDTVEKLRAELEEQAKVHKEDQEAQAKRQKEDQDALKDAVRLQLKESSDEMQSRHDDMAKRQKEDQDALKDAVRLQLKESSDEMQSRHDDMKVHLSSEMKEMQQRMDARGVLPAFVMPPEFLRRLWANYT